MASPTQIRKRNCHLGGVVSVPCPRCKAQKGQQCYMEMAGGPAFRVLHHPERVNEYKLKRGAG